LNSIDSERYYLINRRKKKKMKIKNIKKNRKIEKEKKE
jgi:hypothetical protein